MPKILIIEDDAAFCELLQRYLRKHGYEAAGCLSAEDARGRLKEGPYDLVLTDLRLPESDGLGMLREIREMHPTTRVVLMTGYAEVSSAVKAMKEGASDYIAKPFNPDEMLEVLQNALANEIPAQEQPVKTATTTREQREEPGESPEAANTTGMVRGISEASRKLGEYIKLVGPTDMSVLITGESGTGKEVTAKAIHDCSRRSKEAFVPVDCGAIAKELAASEFFGHLKGSFTGAVEDKVGHFEAANGGTLFLDEVGNLSYEHQVQLLRTLQERKVRRIGSTREIDVDVRILAATNEDLRKAVAEGKFREDLYHRLNEFSVAVPSLRDRHEDLPLFAETFLAKANVVLHKEVSGFSEAVMQAFDQYHWPGNLRELGNVVKRAVLLTQGDLVPLEALPEEVRNPVRPTPEPEEEFSKEAYEKDRIIAALKKTNFNKSKAAKLLQVTRKTLYNKINHYKLDL